MGGALAEDLDEGVAATLGLQLNRLLDRAAGLHAVLRVVKGDAFHIDRAVERGDELGHPERLAHRRGAAVRAGGGALADQRGRRELPAGHAIDGVVHEDDRDRQAHLGDGDGLGEADRGEVAVALVGDDDGLGVGQLVAQRDRGGAAVGGLGVADIEIIKGKHGAAHRADEDGAVLQVQLLDDLGEVAMDDAMAAAGAVVRAMALEALTVRVAPEVLVKDSAHDCTPRVARMARRISSCDGSTPP